MKNYKEEQIENLSFRLERIDFLADCLSKISADRNYSDFYLEISHFVHFIQKDENLGKFLYDLLTIGSKIKEEPDYQRAINRLNVLIQLIAKKFLDRDDFKDFVSKNDYGFSNPIPNSERSSRPDTLLKNLSCYNVVKEGFVKDDFDNIYSIYRTICEKFDSKEGFGEILDLLNEYYELLKTIAFFEVYELKYSGNNSAYNLLIIYKALNPVVKTSSFLFENLQKDLIIKGKKFISENLRTLQNDCHKIFNYLKICLLSNLSIEYTIDRFITYFSLYFDEKIDLSQPEKNLQKKFEEFIFSNGYYPLSEAQLKNGRIDTLIVNDKNSFLFEFKQIDLGTTRETTDKITKKIRSAKVQSSIYHDRLRSFPFLNNTVFILVFSNRQISVSENVDRILVSDLRFIFKFINISDLPPSLQHEQLTVSIKDLIE